MICCVVQPALYGARGGPVPDAPVHHGYCFGSSGIMRELWLGRWEGEWQHSSPDPLLILGNPSRADSRLTHSFWGRVEKQLDRGCCCCCFSLSETTRGLDVPAPINRLNSRRALNYTPCAVILLALVALTGSPVSTSGRTDYWDISTGESARSSLMRFILRQKKVVPDILMSLPI